MSVLHKIGSSVVPPLVGLSVIGGLWASGGYVLRHTPTLIAFTGFAPAATFESFYALVSGGEIVGISLPSLYRVFVGLFFACLVGVPLGLAYGRFRLMERAFSLPFQFLRFISPLSWMPVAVLAFPTWDGAIIFLIAIAALWPVLFATAAGVKRLDPAWVSISQTLGGQGFALMRIVILPAIMPDILAGLRIALGVAWVVLVPAEFLGVTSGLGYAINDARDTLSYDRLAALVLVIGLLGWAIDSFLGLLARRFSWTTSL